MRAPAQTPDPIPEADRTARGARAALLVLTFINLFNYLDRFVPSSVKDLFKAELHLTDAQTSLPLTAFVIVYMLASPIFGALADRWPRKVLIAAGVALWSLATGAAGLASGFTGFLVARALVGIGEAAYGTLSPALLSDYYPMARRNRVLTFFYVAIPVGCAIGYALGGFLGQRWGWRAAFMICGFPGIVLAALTLLLKEPPRSAAAPQDAARTNWPETLRALKANRAYVIAVAGYTAVTFGTGAIGDWLPAYLNRYRGFDLEGANALIGLCSLSGGLLGTAVGGVLADRVKRWTRQPYFALSAVSMVVGTLCVVVVLASGTRLVLGIAMFFANFFVWFYNGPINATLVNVTSARHRARAFSLSILSIHLLGDAISPSIVGGISDVTGGRLDWAMYLVPGALAVGALTWAFGWRTLPESTDAPVAEAA